MSRENHAVQGENQALTINSKKTGERVLRSLRKIVLLAFAGVSLAGCTSSLGSVSAPSASLAPGSSGLDYVPPARARDVVKTEMITKSAQPVKLAMAPVLGPPAEVAKKLTAKIKNQLEKRNIRVIKGKAAYNMRGYVVSSSDGAGGAKLAYIWDLRNRAGRRQHRISGEKRSAGGKAWNSVSDRILDAIASDTAEQMASWLGHKNGGAVKTASRSRARSGRIPVASRGPSVTAAGRASRSRPVVMAMVVPVSGAPGDGKISLTKAIKDRLYSKGIRLTSQRTESVYQVRGVVQLSDAGADKQKIRIDWRVYDPNGKRLGTVTQKNEIPRGSLNGSWGGIADAAAGAAANGITKLLPKGTRRI